MSFEEIENIRLKYENGRMVFNFLIKLSDVNLLRRHSLCFILKAFIQNLRRNIIEFFELFQNLYQILIHTLTSIFSQFIVLGRE